MSEQVNISEPINEEGATRKRKVTGWPGKKPMETIKTTKKGEASRDDFKSVNEESDMASKEQEVATGSKKRKYTSRRKKAKGAKRMKKRPTRVPKERVVKDKAPTVAFVRHWYACQYS